MQSSFPPLRFNAVTYHVTLAIPKYYGDICRQGAWDYILGSVANGGYGLSTAILTDQEQYELTWALLYRDNFAYAAGVSI